MMINNKKVFICYSHEDKEWLEGKILTHLSPLVRNKTIELFDDTKIPYGGKIEQTIREKLSSAEIAIFLVSADFFTSKFIQDIELPVLLEAAEQNGTVVLSIIISYCAFEDSFLSIYRAINPPSRPLLEMGRAEQDKTFYELYKFIKTILPSPETEQGPIPDQKKSLNKTNEDCVSAEKHIFNGQFEQAIREATAILEEEPNNVDALLIRAWANNLFYKTEDNVIRDAAQVLVAVKDRKDCIGLMQYAYALFLLGRHKLALEHINKLIAKEVTNTPIPETNPCLYKAAFLRMRIEYALMEYTNSIKDADWLLSINKNDWQVWFRKGQAHLGLKEYEEAVRCENIAIEHIPDFWVIYDIRASAYGGLKKFQNALDDCSNLLEKAPWYNSTRRYKAAILTDLKRYTEALSEIGIALMYEPNDIPVLEMQSESLFNLGDYSNAKKSAENILKCDTKNEYAIDILSKIETKNKDVSNINFPNNPKILPPLPPINKKSSIFDLIRRF
ncbi:MAG: TIR domain-containing protein [Methylococcaceae bacterium]|nr:TIR domain-containing protein [Methylococcaceae bacterium]